MSLIRVLLQTNPLSHSSIKQIHAQLLTNSLTSPQYLSKLILHYLTPSFPNLTEQAQNILNSHPNTFLLNTLIKSLHPKHSFRLFAIWVSKNTLVFDTHTFIFTLGACARSRSGWEGKQVHCRGMKAGFMSDLMVGTTCIHFYAENRSVCDAREVFDEMLVRNVVTWNAIIKGYCSMKVGDGEYARKGLLLFKGLLVDVEGNRPTDTTMLCVLSAASQLGVLETGTCVHSYVEKMIDNPENDVFIGTVLVDMYSKCGSLESASYVFERMKTKNVLTWTSMVTGLALHGKGKDALNLLDEMKLSGVRPNEVTFTSLFSACCYTGLVEEGLCLFYSMERKFKVSPLIRHYGCVVDLLGRAGLLKEAYEFIKDMKIEPDVILWRSLLNACKVHEDIEMGEKVGKILLDFPLERGSVQERGKSQDYIALSNVYASVDRWENVGIVRDIMKMEGMQTKPGCSFINSSSR